MEFGIYLDGELVEEYSDIIKDYEDATYVTKESGVPHEVKVISEEN